jgi:hypothetical protein
VSLHSGGAAATGAVLRGCAATRVHLIGPAMEGAHERGVGDAAGWGAGVAVG